MRYDRIDAAVAALIGSTPDEWAWLPPVTQQRLVDTHRATVLAVYRAARANDDANEVRNGGGGDLPGVYPHPYFTVGVWVSRYQRRWCVNVRTHDGAYIVLAEYRTRWGAARFARRSWRLAR